MTLNKYLGITLLVVLSSVCQGQIVDGCSWADGDWQVTEFDGEWSFNDRTKDCVLQIAKKDGSIDTVQGSYTCDFGFMQRQDLFPKRIRVVTEEGVNIKLKFKIIPKARTYSWQYNRQLEVCLKWNEERHRIRLNPDTTSGR